MYMVEGEWGHDISDMAEELDGILAEDAKASAKAETPMPTLEEEGARGEDPPRPQAPMTTTDWVVHPANPTGCSYLRDEARCDTARLRALAHLEYRPPPPPQDQRNEILEAIRALGTRQETRLDLVHHRLDQMNKRLTEVEGGLRRQPPPTKATAPPPTTTAAATAATPRPAAEEEEAGSSRCRKRRVRFQDEPSRRIPPPPLHRQFGMDETDGDRRGEGLTASGQPFVLDSPMEILDIQELPRGDPDASFALTPDGWEPPPRNCSFSEFFS